jgi:hypothetical protein
MLVSRPAGEGVGYVRSSEDTRKGKSGRSEGTLHQERLQLMNVGLTLLLLAEICADDCSDCEGYIHV